MFKKYLIAMTMVMTALQTQANNREESDSMFGAKTNSTLVEQAVIGFGEYVLFNMMHVKEHGLAPLANVNITNNTKFIEEAEAKLAKGGLLAEEVEDLQKRLAKAHETIHNEKLRLIRNSEAAVARSRNIQKALFVGQALIVVDLFGRLYVWQKLDRDPGISPTSTFVLKKMGVQ